MFNKYFENGKQFTKVVRYFMMYGVAALFIIAGRILAGKTELGLEKGEVEVVEVAYLKKYGIF